MVKTCFPVLFAALLAMYSFLFTPSYAADDAYSGTVNIIQGQTRLMPYPGVNRVSIGHPDIANAQPTGPDEILLTGLKNFLENIFQIKIDILLFALQ